MRFVPMKLDRIASALGRKNGLCCGSVYRYPFGFVINYQWKLTEKIKAQNSINLGTHPFGEFEIVFIYQEHRHTIAPNFSQLKGVPACQISRQGGSLPQASKLESVLFLKIDFRYPSIVEQQRFSHPRVQ